MGRRAGITVWGTVGCAELKCMGSCVCQASTLLPAAPAAMPALLRTAQPRMALAPEAARGTGRSRRSFQLQLGEEGPARALEAAAVWQFVQLIAGEEWLSRLLPNV